MSELTRADCEALDGDDELAYCRKLFAVPENTVYLDGNSLGVMPKAAVDVAREVVAGQWGQGLIRSWNDAGWWELPTRLGDKIASLIGAGPGEVIMTDSTGIDLYKALCVGLQLVPDRGVILMEGSNFPTNNYIAQGLVEQLGSGYEVRFVEEAGLEEAIDSNTAIVCLTQVHYKSGRKLDMEKITGLAHDAGAVTVWDLCHSAGALEVDLEGCGVDLAVGCTYKYLNGGPGSPAFIYVARRHQDIVRQPLTGWWGHTAPFEFARDYEPARGIRQMLTGTQPIVSLSIAEVGLDIFLGVDMSAVRQKSLALTGLFMELIDRRCNDFGFNVITPREPKIRGSQVSLEHDDGFSIMQALIARGVIGDYRAPGNLRFGFTPLYTTYCDVWDAVDYLVQVMDNEEWRNDAFNKRAAVT